MISDHFLTQLITPRSQVVHECYLKFIWWLRIMMRKSLTEIRVRYNIVYDSAALSFSVSSLQLQKWCNSKAQSTSCARRLCRPSWAHYPLAYKIVVRQRSAKRKKSKSSEKSNFCRRVYCCIYCLVHNFILT